MASVSGYQVRKQRTLSRSVRTTGFGLFSGIDVNLELCPANPDSGIVFERTDLTQPVSIPAHIDYVVPRPRCTVIGRHGVHVGVVEHVVSALAGMQIDNCRIRLNAPEPPGFDGSALQFVEMIDRAGITEQDANRQVLTVEQVVSVMDNEHIGVVAMPPRRDEYELGYLLNYAVSGIGEQSFRTHLSPERYQHEICAARTFVEQHEVDALQAQGIGLRATSQNLLVFGPHGPIENTVRFPNECARHKLLDCIGDFALIGCDLVGRFVAQRSGHRLNHALVREIRAAHQAFFENLSTSSVPVRRAG